jgi:ribonucleoside-diphosphate reductase beta chain
MTETIVYKSSDQQFIDSHNEFEEIKKLTIQEYIRKNPLTFLTKKDVLIADRGVDPWCEDNWLLQNKLHWIYDEISMRDDQKEWQTLQESSKTLLTRLFLFFTQIEVEINQMYVRYIDIFQPFELKKMFLKFAEVETMHIAAYKYLMANIFGEKTNEMLHNFLNHAAMKDKYDALQQYKLNTVYDLCLTLVMFGGFSEGVLLYASFAIFLFFPHVNKVLKGTGQLLSWTMRDESLHVLCSSLTYKDLLKELPKGFHEYLSKDVYKNVREMVKLECSFVDWIFGDLSVPGLEKEDLKKYIEFMANTRLLQFGFQPIYDAGTNTLPWMSSLGNVEFTNFFEGTVTEYNRASNNEDEADSITKDNIATMFE